jgi:hypothetical protein
VTWGASLTGRPPPSWLRRKRCARFALGQ